MKVYYCLCFAHREFQARCAKEVPVDKLTVKLLSLSALSTFFFLLIPSHVAGITAAKRNE